ncbi:hypothetical protein [Methylocystis heyeri]|uniref:RiboL-PSP-HEPN domain-containing protein n=1 Tax=Methylocystis heyeri TaxID=391905 RepID=A0A6B8KHI4_9HYPH|nr:hypothetical protein [Methylocystis heyeri]QGM46471.1 hypothetical protein H2LOC_012635 [Methylocystis heyeri]
MIGAILCSGRRADIIPKWRIKMTEENPLVKILSDLNNKAYSRSMYFFSKDLTEALNLFLFTVDLATRVDKSVVIGSKALISGSTGEDRERHLRNIEAIEKGGGAFGKLKEFNIINSRHLLTTSVEAFDCYLSHIIRCVLLKNPQMLRSSEKISIDELYDFKSKRELSHYIADRKVSELSYSGIRGIEKYLKDVFGVDMFGNTDSKDLLIVFMELRNIHVHNRGFVNRLFLSKVKNHCGFKFEFDRRYVVYSDDLMRLMRNLIDVGLRIDRIISVKFHLDRKKGVNWKKSKPKYES